MKWDSSREMTRDVLDRSKGQTMTVNRIISIRTGIRFERQLNPETRYRTFNNRGVCCMSKYNKGTYLLS